MSQTLAQFVATNTAKKLDFDGIWPGQCVDGARCYLRDCFGLVYEPPPMPGADDWYRSKAQPSDHKHQIVWIANKVGDSTQYPKPGDLIIWGEDKRVGTGSYGHISIFYSGDGLHFRGFEQNWPLGSKMHLQFHDYRGVLGWGRVVVPGAAPPAPTPKPAPVVVAPAPTPPVVAPVPPVVVAPESVPPPRVPIDPSLQGVLIYLLQLLRALLH